MTKSASARSQAESLFVSRGLPLDEIAGIVGVNRATVARWSKAGGWVEKRKQRQLVSPSAGLEKLRELRRDRLATMTKDAAAGDVDALYKLDVMIAREEGKIGNPGAALDVLERFALYVARRCPPDIVDALRDAMQGHLTELRQEGANDR